MQSGDGATRSGGGGSSGARRGFMADRERYPRESGRSEIRERNDGGGRGYRLFFRRPRDVGNEEDGWMVMLKGSRDFQPAASVRPVSEGGGGGQLRGEFGFGF
ncbi:hypothetical protein Hdeb2414_s0006g00212071 [Helianthus debilis subsp. tardiflorus]